MHWATSTIVCHNLTKLIGYYIPTILNINALGYQYYSMSQPNKTDRCYILTIQNINALGYQYYSMSQPNKTDRILYTNDTKHKCTGLPVL